MSVQDKLKELGITLPAVSAPAAAYVPFVRTGNLVFLSGHIAKKDGKAWVGQFGKNMTTEQGKAAARAIAIDLMGTLQAAVGDLEKVKRIVKVMSLVNSTPGLHRAAPGHQRRQRIARPGLRRQGRPCPQRVRRRPDSDGRLRRDRADRGSGVMPV